ncbi:hypothetical protein HanRHA438_Chr11g0528861 [Helianthus annuus]|nr:hypothetical protein HanHA89_Chr11g0448351 [Helianthus annuus]KAJ0687406.1 hypothetical protein HanLR1_Chr11g0425701 [Helianthus annuus]KAJ0872889.1 hypothetical protein HanRHA438_Chr11g0528861 [Helianthus annuus]
MSLTSPKMYFTQTIRLLHFIGLKFNRFDANCFDAYRFESNRFDPYLFDLKMATDEYAHFDQIENLNVVIKEFVKEKDEKKERLRS